MARSCRQRHLWNHIMVPAVCLFILYPVCIYWITFNNSLHDTVLVRSGKDFSWSTLQRSTQLIITWVWRNLWIQCIEWYWNTNSSIARVSFENRKDAKSFLNSLARLRMNKWMNNSIINSGILMCQIFFSRVYHLFNSDWARILFLFRLFTV